MPRPVLVIALGFVVLWYSTDVRTAFLCSTTAFVAFVAVRGVQFREKLRQVQHIPHRCYVLTPWDSLLSLFLPPIKYVNAPLNDKINNAKKRRAVYEDAKSTIHCTVSAFRPRISLAIADAVAIKSIFGDRKLYPKPLGLYRILAVYGENVLITEGDEWRTHRKIVGPAFSETTNELSWQQSTIVTKLWIQDLQKKADEKGMTFEEDVPKVCLHVALAVSAIIHLYIIKQS